MIHILSVCVAWHGWALGWLPADAGRGPHGGGSFCAGPHPVSVLAGPDRPEDATDSSIVKCVHNSCDARHVIKCTMPRVDTVAGHQACDHDTAYQALQRRPGYGHPWCVADCAEKSHFYMYVRTHR
ncbi:hypothetical protein CBL_00765 [Carabus blaptoides fortunei]